MAPDPQNDAPSGADGAAPLPKNRSAAAGAASAEPSGDAASETAITATTAGGTTAANGEPAERPGFDPFRLMQEVDAPSAEAWRANASAGPTGANGAAPHLTTVATVATAATAAIAAAGTNGAAVEGPTTSSEGATPPGPESSSGSENAPPSEGAETKLEEPKPLFGLRRALQSAVRVLTKERQLPPFMRDVGTGAPGAIPEPEANGDQAIDGQDLAGVDTDAATTEGGFHDEATAGESEPEAALPEAALLGGAPAATLAESALPEDMSRWRPTGLCGHTSTIAVPEVLGFLAQLQKTGALWIWNRNEQYRVQLVHGNVTFARNETPRQGSLLGEILVAQGAIEPEVLDEFLAGPRPPGPLGDSLVRAGLIERSALTSAVQYQAQRVFNRAYGIQDAFFCFDTEDRTESPAGIRISVTQMLFESARERDEAARRLDDVFGGALDG